MRTTWCMAHGVNQCSCFRDFMQGFMGGIPDTHTPADLAMALELANRIQRETWFANEHQGDTISPEADWLRAQVIAALYGMEAR